MPKFLSFLCGGEQSLYARLISTGFLSRLRGGELLAGFGGCIYQFLSRLCGGEQRLNEGMH